MSGSVEGGRVAAATNKKKYGDDYYAKIGAMGGKLGHTGGFAAKRICVDPDCDYYTWSKDHLVAQCAGFKGGQISKRTKRVA